MAKAERERIPLRLFQIAITRHRFPPKIVQHAVWLYTQSTLAFRDVEDLIAERGIDVPTRRKGRLILSEGGSPHDARCVDVTVHDERLPIAERPIRGAILPIVLELALYGFRL